MKKSPHSAVRVLAALVLGFSATAVLADGLSIRFGDSRGFGHSHRTYGPVTSFSNSYGPVPSFGARHRLGGRNQYNLNSTRLDPHPQIRFKTFRDRDRFNRFKRKHHGFDPGYGEGYRDGFRDGVRSHRSLHERRFGKDSLHDRRFSR